MTTRSLIVIAALTAASTACGGGTAVEPRPTSTRPAPRPARSSEPAPSRPSAVRRDAPADPGTARVAAIIAAPPGFADLVEPTAATQPATTTPAPAAAPGVAFCYLYVDPDRGSFSNCFPSLDACRSGVARSVSHMAGGRDAPCTAAAAPFCAIAEDGTGAITFRSCAVDASVCEQQRQRAVRAIATGMIAGAEPTCRPARPEDINRPQR